MATIAAILYGSQNPPAVLLTLSGMGAVTTFNVYAQAPGEPKRPVRGGIAAAPAGAAVVLLVDTAAPLNRAVTYVLETFTASPIGVQVSAAPITVPFTVDGIAKHVLSDPVTGQAVPVALLADPDVRTNQARASILEPSGSPWPVVLFDVRRGDGANLPVFTRSRADTLALVELLAPGRPIVSRHTDDGCDVASVEWLYPFDADRARVNRAGARRWTIPVLAIGLPDPYLVPSLVTLQNIANFYTGRALTAIAADYATLLALAQDDFGA